ncbi:MAG: succinyl-diaminopimelate desuccinylase [Wenzhouxiangella sp.]|nr:MAG: succinyl-diaminopimelate desuccinylase [Wenzhouxiangella sp.]
MIETGYNAASGADVLALARALISRPSVTPDDAGCCELIAGRLEAAGMATEFVDVGEVRNLLAVHGSGAPHLMLLGHTDVVPPGPEQAWTSPPFEPAVRNGFLHGRGAADMKGSVAAFVVALERFLTEVPGHAGTVSLLLTSDEEGVARDGVRAMVPVLKQRGLLPDFCLVGEPSSRDHLGDEIRIGRRGSIQARLTVRGVQGHTAYAHAADNPVHRAGPLLAELGGLVFEDGDPFFPPTKLQISNVRAGTGAENVTPGTLEVWFNIRNNPHSLADKLKDRIEAIIERHDPGPWTLDWRISGEPFGPAAGALPAAVTAACRDILGREPEANTGGGTSDGRFLGPEGVSVVELGPVNRSIHQVDECVRLSDLEQLPRVYADVIRRLLAG